MRIAGAVFKLHTIRAAVCVTHALVSISNTLDLAYGAVDLLDRRFHSGSLKVESSGCEVIIERCRQRNVVDKETAPVGLVFRQSGHVFTIVAVPVEKIDVTEIRIPVFAVNCLLIAQSKAYLLPLSVRYNSDLVSVTAALARRSKEELRRIGALTAAVVTINIEAYFSSFRNSSAEIDAEMRPVIIL